MPTQLHLPTPPAGAQEINAVVAVVRERGDVAYFASGVPVFIHREDDRVGQRVAVAQLVTLNGLEPRYPGTDLKLVYEAPDVA